MTAAGGRVVLVTRELRAASRKSDPEVDRIPKQNVPDVTSLHIRSFRRAVLNKDATTITALVQSTLATEQSSHAERITWWVLKRGSSEPTKEALMTAISMGTRQLVELILSLFKEFPGEEFNGCRRSYAFPPHITPLMLACLCNDFDIVELLLLRNHQIELPHRCDCECETCVDTAMRFSHALTTLDTYMAISSEAFLWLACADPVLAALNLAADLEVNSHIHQEHRSAYWQLHENVMRACVRMMEQCWHMEDVTLVLSQKDGIEFNRHNFPYPRLRLALDCHMRTLLSVVDVQNALRGCWRGSWGNYGTSGSRDALRVINHSFLLPFRACFHILSAGLLLASFRNPIARFFSRLSSYLFFLIVLLTVRLLMQSGDRSTNRHVTQSALATGLECYIYIHMLGVALLCLMDLLKHGLSNFDRSWWKWFDLALIWLFVASAFCSMMTAASISQDGITCMHRRHWVFYDFSLLYDIFFGSACILAFWRIVYYIQLWRRVGSTVISIVRCAQICFIFLAFMLAVMFSFALGLNTLHQSYKGGTVLQEDATLLRMKDKFSGVFETLRHLYWSFYGYLGPWEYAMAVGNVGPEFKPANHELTRIAGELIVGIYHIVVVITLLKMMVTLLIWRCDTVERDEDIEWKFMRSLIYSEYFDWYTELPPPFNILYIPAIKIRRLIEHLIRVFRKKELQNEPSEESNLAEAVVYQNLLRMIYKRRVHSTKYMSRTVQSVDAEQCLKTCGISMSDD